MAERRDGRAAAALRPRRRLPRAILACAVMMAAVWRCMAADWPAWRGAARDGMSPDTGLLREWPAGGPKLLWKTGGIGKGFSTVSVVGGVVYTAGDRDGEMTITALGGEGNVLWQTRHDQAWTKSHPGSRSTPTIDSGRLYVVSGHGAVGCYDASSGKNIWSRKLSEFGGRPPGWGYAESVLIHGDLAVVTPGGRSCIAALNKATGETVWVTRGYEAEAQYGSCYAFAYGGMPMIVTGTRAGIVCVAAEDGRVLWSNPFCANNTANCPTPIFADRYIFWANGYGKGGICLELTVEGKEVRAREAWKTGDMVCHHGGYVVKDGFLYGNHDGGWSCLELATGQRKWHEKAVGKGSLCYADGMLYLFSERGGRGALATCSPEGLEVRGEVKVDGEGPSWAHPVVIGGRLYLRYDDTLYCFDVQAR
ncbi:MAG: PQQ-like beta-propeller repeat protein [Lentisphaeria bacterium]|nr:PQQ-like beta-propeller repeat protein [Lentisphaeria bacterium]